MKRILFLLPLLVAVAGCGIDADADMALSEAEGKPHRVTLYSGGRVVREWTTDRKVRSQNQSDGWYFRDSKTGALVRVSGNVVIEVVVEPERKPQA